MLRLFNLSFQAPYIKYVEGDALIWAMTEGCVV